MKPKRLESKAGDPTSRSLPTTIEKEIKGGGQVATTGKKIAYAGESNPRSIFTKEMVVRAHEDAILPHELLYTIAVSPDITFTDYKFEKGELIAFDRRPTPEERMQCARDVMPYYASKKPVEVAHQGQIEILHSIARTSLDAIEIDDQGNVIDTDDAEFEDIDE